MSTEQRGVIVSTLISEADRRRPVGVLALGPKTARLQQAGLHDLGHVIDDAAQDFFRLRGVPALGRRTLDQVRERLAALGRSLDETGRVDWNAWARLCGLLEGAEDEPIGVFSDADRALGIERLHLGVRGPRIQAGGLTTLGQLLDDQARGFLTLSRAPRLGEVAASLVARRLRSLDACRSADGRVDWDAFDALCRGQPATGQPGMSRTPQPGQPDPACDGAAPRVEIGPVRLSDLAGEAAREREPAGQADDAPPLAADQRRLPVSCLALGRKTGRIAAGGLATLGDVADDAAAGWLLLSRVPGVGRGAIQLVEERLGIALSCAGPDGLVDWRAFGLLCGLAEPEGDIEPLPGNGRARPVTALHLGARASRLIEIGLRTVGDLVDDRAAGYPRVEAADWLGRQAVDLIERRLRMLQLCRTGDGEIDWELFDGLCAGRVVRPPVLPRSQPPRGAEPMRPFSDRARARPVEVLRLGPKAKFLRQAGLRTVGHLLTDGALLRLSRLPGIGGGTAETIRLRLADLAASLDAQGEPAWDAVAAGWGYPVVPERPLITGADFVDAVPEAIAQWIEAHEEEADRLILRSRFGQARQARATLEALGRRLGVSRERIRQRQKKCLDGLAAALLDDDQSGSPVQFSDDFRNGWVTAARTLSTSRTLVWPAFVSALERAWGVPSARLTDVLPFALAVLTEEGQVVAPRHPVPPNLLEPLPATLLRRSLRSFPIGRACMDLEAQDVGSFGGLLLAAMENRLPQGRSGEASARLLAAVAASLTEAGEIDSERLAIGLDLPFLPSVPSPSPAAFLAAFDAAVAQAALCGRMPGRARDIWQVRTRQPPETRPTLERTAAALGSIGSMVKREETLLLSLLNAQLVDGDQSRAGVVWRSDFLALAAQAAAVRQEVGEDFATFVDRLATRWDMEPARLRGEAAGLWAVLSLYPAGSRRRRAGPSATQAEPREATGSGEELIVLRGFRRRH